MPEALNDIMERTIPERAAQRLLDRAPLPVDPSRSIAVKRDVHEYVVEADAETFARAFAEVMTDPDGRFGLIRVKRPAARMGRDFVPGERFQGSYSVSAALLAALERGPGRAFLPLAARLLATPLVRWTVGRLEDAMLSDYAVIDELVLDPEPGEVRTLRYCYLDGTPIAGSSRFSIAPLGPGRCRVEQVFEYQEVNSLALGTFQRFGLKMHDQVVHMQVCLAATRAGAPRPVGTIPLAYAEGDPPAPSGRRWGRRATSERAGGSN